VTGNKRPLPQDEAEEGSPSRKKSKTDSSTIFLTSSKLAQQISHKNTQTFITDNSINHLILEGKAELDQSRFCHTSCCSEYPSEFLNYFLIPKIVFIKR